MAVISLTASWWSVSYSPDVSCNELLGTMINSHGPADTVMQAQ